MPRAAVEFLGKAAGWRDAVASVGLPGCRLHELGHTGNTLAASSGAGTRGVRPAAGGRRASGLWAELPARKII
ncbi:hypothetical protein Adi01nite_66820 [Amorphoplanes digitatis]|nr:hypothetical protein Adi01nite_66820 [Actinoplanes digitatis]